MKQFDIQTTSTEKYKYNIFKLTQTEWNLSVYMTRVKIVQKYVYTDSIKYIKIVRKLFSAEKREYLPPESENVQGE